MADSEATKDDGTLDSAEKSTELRVAKLEGSAELTGTDEL